MEVNNLNLCIKTKLVTVGADAMINCKVCLVIIADTSICFLIPVSYFGANYLAYVNYTYAPSFFFGANYFAYVNCTYMCHLFSLLQCILPSNIPRLLINRVFFVWFLKTVIFYFCFKLRRLCLLPVLATAWREWVVARAVGSPVLVLHTILNNVYYVNNLSKKHILSKHQNTLSLKKTAF